MLKTIFLNSLKLLVAGGLIYWLVSSGKLDFKLLAQLQHYPGSVLIAVMLTIANFCLVSFRWRKILNARAETELPMLGMIQVTWIGQFFSSVLPGSVSGDLVKILYVQKLNTGFSKRFIFASILIDRLMGLSGLILLVGISSLLFSSHILKNAPDMQPLLTMNYALAIMVVITLGLFFFCHDLIRKVLQKLESLFLRKVWEKVIVLWDDLTAIKGKMMKAVGISLIVQFIAVLTFWSIIHPFVKGTMDFIEALAFIPIGLMTLALPVAPSGLGVGHAIFQKLFQFSGINNGASLFNLFFFVTLSVNLLGAIPYLLNKKNPAN
ncbi:MAG TPA: lysylphosphatidylglycerol synthase transmembrane domain-containing protein [Bacteriovoracaceae bacterium]|nr:lysylphosphatidylglycerol synthase transmembrane domain-containing protein [Bacteriovoracaceae bacterium]